jgi:hypothetical protein
MSNIGFIGLGIMGKPLAANPDQGRPHALSQFPGGVPWGLPPGRKPAQKGGAKSDIII